MHTKIIPLLLCALVLSGCQRTTATQDAQTTSGEDSYFQEHCFSVIDERIGFEVATLTPEEYLERNEKAIAAINGPYYAADNDKLLGYAYLDGTEHGTGRGDIRGYFMMKAPEGGFVVTEEPPISFSDFHLVIATHPVLVKDGVVHTHAEEDRYNKRKDEDGNYTDLHTTFRSAIGNKSDHELCFAVVQQGVTMDAWAQELQTRGYRNAINLDGGFESQLAVRGKNPTGFLTEESRLIIYTTK